MLELDWAAYRRQFPALHERYYFNYGGQGPMARSSLTAIAQAHETWQSLGPFSSAANCWIVEEAHLTRKAIAAELQVSPETIALTENVSVGCNIALWGHDWQTGDHLLLSDCEHPSVIATVQELQRRFGLEVSHFSLLSHPESQWLEAIAQQLRPQTRLLMLSHVLWNTGQILPLQAIAQLCHRQPQPVLVAVDAAQSVGLLPLNLTELEIDFYAFTGHKWLCGPAGLGGLYVRPELSLHPTFLGWRGISRTPDDRLQWRKGAERFEVATSDYALYAGLRAAIALHQQVGSALERYQRIGQLSRDLWHKLQALPMLECLLDEPPPTGLVAFRLRHSSPEQRLHRHPQWVDQLERQKILVRTLAHPPVIRACVHYFTTSPEIDTLVQSLTTLG